VPLCSVPRIFDKPEFPLQSRHFRASTTRVAPALLACDLLTWTQALALSGPLRVAEPKTPRLRLLAIAARLTRSGRRIHLRLDRRWPWAGTVAAAVATLRAIPDPG
jgi:Transposase DDE domain group 1